MMDRIKFYTRIYSVIITAVLILILATPFLGSRIYILDRDYSEILLLSSFLVIGLATSFIYQREVRRHKAEMDIIREDKKTLEERLEDAFKYIGQINVQLQEIKTAFSDIKKYPETKKDYLKILRYLSDRILGMVDVDWVIFRIIQLNDMSTLIRYDNSRSHLISLRINIDNHNLVNNDNPNLTVVSSGQENLNIKAFCIMPHKELTWEQKEMTRAIVNQLEMMFVIYTSMYVGESKIDITTLNSDEKLKIEDHN